MLTIQKLRCGLCWTQFEDLLELQNHLKTHEGVSEWKCHQCQRVLKSQFNLQSHYNRTHAVDDEFRSTFGCDICGRSYRNGLLESMIEF